MDPGMYRAPVADEAPPSQSPPDIDPQRPNRLVGCLFAALCGIGVGHFYVGLKRRALCWLGGAGVSFVCAALLIPIFAKASAFGWALPALLGAFLVSWLGPLVDLLTVPQRRFAKVPLWQVAGYVVAAQLASIVFSFSVRTWLVEAFKIPSATMGPTLLNGDHIFVDKRRRRDAERGDVLVFQHPEQASEDYVKRAVGLPGDVIEMKGGALFVNGWQVPRCVLGQSSLPGSEPGDNETGRVALEFLDGRAYLTFSGSSSAGMGDGRWTVGPGECFVLGDYRTNSADSRTWFGGRGGGVPLGNVKGRALGVWMNIRGDAVDWSRAGVSVFEPVLPSSMQGLQAALEKCLRERPNDVETRPPRNAIR